MEIVCALNKERAFNEEPLLANPRNAAAGTLKTLNPAEVARRGLDAYFYFLLGDNLPYTTHYESLQSLRKWGFKVSDATELLRDVTEAKRFIDHWAEARKQLEVVPTGWCSRSTTFSSSVCSEARRSRHGGLSPINSRRRGS